MNLNVLGRTAKQILPKLGKCSKAAQKAKPQYIKTGYIGLEPYPSTTAIQNGVCVRSHAQLVDFRKFPAADTFRRSAAKQNAEIINDVVGFPNTFGLPYRVVTKKLPSGTFVSKVFDEAGRMEAKEVIKKKATAITRYDSNGKVYTYHITNGNKNIASMDGSVVRWQPPYSVTNGYKSGLDFRLQNFRGITEEVNKGNVFYDSQKAIWEAEQNMLKARRGY